MGDDLICHVCNAIVTPLGQEGGVFCTQKDCPGYRLCHFDVTNTCAENTFCLNFSGKRVEVKSQEMVPTAVVLRKKKTKPAPKGGPDLFEAVS